LPVGAIVIKIWSSNLHPPKSSNSR
jgi:hypothetical protein